MRYMIIVKANAESEAGAKPTKELFNAMATYHEELTKAGVLVDASGLHPTSKGWRVEMKGEQRSTAATVTSKCAGSTNSKTSSRAMPCSASAKCPGMGAR